MRYVLALALVGVIGSVGVIGCGSSGLNGNDDMGTADMTATGTDDMNVGDGGSGGPCDVPTQTGCASGQKCVAAQGGTMMNPMIVGKCVTAGTVTDGQPCMRGMNGMPDNCASGLTCSRIGLPTGMTVCRKYCANDASCSSDPGQKCALLAGGLANFGSCAPACTPFGTDCPTGMTCAAIEIESGSTMSNINAFLACRTAGAGAAYDACMRSSDCGANLFCDQQQGWCAPLCGTGHACTQPPAVDGGAATVSCMVFANAGSTGLGVCQ